MAKFGDLINRPKVLLCFMDGGGYYASFDVNDIARALSATDVSVINIPAEKNVELLQALSVEELPSVLYYENGEQKKRLQTELTADKVLEYMKTVLK